MNKVPLSCSPSLSRTGSLSRVGSRIRRSPLHSGHIEVEETIRVSQRYSIVRAETELPFEEEPGSYRAQVALRERYRLVFEMLRFFISH
jgi:hypothetical protein